MERAKPIAPAMAWQSAWERASERARRQFGAIARWQLLEMANSPSRIEHWLRSGRLHSVMPGVYALGRRELGAEGVTAAALLHARRGAALTGISALWWQPSPSPPQPHPRRHPQPGPLAPRRPGRSPHTPPPPPPPRPAGRPPRGGAARRDRPALPQRPPPGPRPRRVREAPRPPLPRGGRPLRPPRRLQAPRRHRRPPAGACRLRQRLGARLHPALRARADPDPRAEPAGRPLPPRHAVEGR
jgi:hypothetical protein